MSTKTPSRLEKMLAAGHLAVTSECGPPRGSDGEAIAKKAEMIKDNVLDARGRGPNTALIMNVIDYLNNREDIAVMRGKEQRFNPLDDIGASAKTFIKAFNMLGLPLLVVLFGMTIWLRRRSRKKQIQMMFQK